MPAKQNKLEKLYREVADLTKPRCAACPVPNSCCEPMYCEMTIDYAKANGVTLEPTGHPKLPMMGKDGCIAPPHLRPICSVHVCERHYASDFEFRNKYFKLRNKIDTLEWNMEEMRREKLDVQKDSR